MVPNTPMTSGQTLDLCYTLCSINKHCYREQIRFRMLIFKIKYQSIPYTGSHIHTHTQRKTKTKNKVCLYAPLTIRLRSFGRGLRSLWMEQMYWPSSCTSTFCIWRLYSCLSPTLETMDTRGSTDHLSFPANMMLERFNQAPLEIPSNR